MYPFELRVTDCDLRRAIGVGESDAEGRPKRQGASLGPAFMPINKCPNQVDLFSECILASTANLGYP